VGDVRDGNQGDLSAVEGTQAELQITTDKPLKNGVLMFDTNQQLQLSGGQNNVYTEENMKVCGYALRNWVNFLAVREVYFQVLAAAKKTE